MAVKQPENLTQLRTAVGEMTDKARQGSGPPRPADIAEARKLWELRKAHLSDSISSNVAVKYPLEKEPDWNSWPAIAEMFAAYHAAIIELQTRLSAASAEERLKGI